MSTTTSPISATNIDKPQTSQRTAPPTTDHSYSASIYAGFVKSLIAKTTLTLTIWAKGILKWWFRYPIKMFRPYTISPYYMFTAMANHEGKVVTFGYMKSVLSDEGFHFLRKNMLPLLIANGFAGALLFNIYGVMSEILKYADRSFQYYHPFLSGATAGLIHSVLAAPLDNIATSIPADEFLNRKDVGMLRVTKEAIKKALPSDEIIARLMEQQTNLASNTFRRQFAYCWIKYHFLFRDWSMIALKDSLGFMMFFGIFESFRHLGRVVVEDHLHFVNPKIVRASLPQTAVAANDMDGNRYQNSTLRDWREQFQMSGYTLANSVAVLGAGGLAGMAFQLVAYPLERLRMQHVHDHHLDRGTLAFQYDRLRLRRLRVTIRTHGVAFFYRGIQAQLLRTMPPSAIGLLVYEYASSQFFEDT